MNMLLLLFGSVGRTSLPICLRSFVPSMGGGVEVLAWDDYDMGSRPCIDCGRRTRRFCGTLTQKDSCLAQERGPSEKWSKGQHTPLCSICQEDHKACRLCRKTSDLSFATSRGSCRVVTRVSGATAARQVTLREQEATSSGPQLSRILANNKHSVASDSRRGTRREVLLSLP